MRTALPVGDPMGPSDTPRRPEGSATWFVNEPRVKKYLEYRYPSMTTPRSKMKRRPHLYGGKLK